MDLLLVARAMQICFVKERPMAIQGNATKLVKAIQGLILEAK